MSRAITSSYEPLQIEATGDSHKSKRCQIPRCRVLTILVLVIVVVLGSILAGALKSRNDNQIAPFPGNGTLPINCTMTPLAPSCPPLPPPINDNREFVKKIILTLPKADSIDDNRDIAGCIKGDGLTSSVFKVIYCSDGVLFKLIHQDDLCFGSTCVRGYGSSLTDYHLALRYSENPDEIPVTLYRFFTTDWSHKCDDPIPDGEPIDGSEFGFTTMHVNETTFRENPTYQRLSKILGQSDDYFRLDWWPYRVPPLNFNCHT